MTSHRLLRTAVVAAATLASACVFAQADKSPALERLLPYPAFDYWIALVVMPSPEQMPVPMTELVAFTAPTGGTQTYQPQPVILGVPELPLVGTGASLTPRAWNMDFNYQGVRMRQVVSGPRAGEHDVRSMGAPLRPGDRFKIRITPTFDAVARIDQVVGDPWYGQRTGQVYPQGGNSVQVHAGETVDLPVAANEYFVVTSPVNERLVVSVRHAKASPEASSNQPAYRQDTKFGSSYLQLVPRGTYPNIEQLVSQVR